MFDLKVYFQLLCLLLEQHFISLFEPELALLVGLQVMCTKGGEVEMEGELYDKILYAWTRRS